jgi:hypothetical protein
MGRISGVQTGVAAEYFVAAELSRRGYVASLTSNNTKDIDLLASNSDASRTVCIQVKAKQGSEREWMLTRKCETIRPNLFFYVFVNLNGLEAPEYFIVPNHSVAEFARRAQADYMRNLGKKGQQRKETSIRVFRDYAEEFLNRWELIELDDSTRKSESSMI